VVVDYANRIDISDLEHRLKYKFRHRIYAIDALSIGSAAKRRSSRSQRLEFLGDSVIDVLVTRKLFYSMPNGDPGTLTKAREEVVCNDAFALVCHKLGLIDIFLSP